ncbi:CaiB/BaiF CoA transferase family protein [Sphingobium sp. YBL2]|uniref:CaiB/BaiF CoA transferase family protein n=1 Tax=Sphingobium sp. (strain YBL2) TaxID=484429 RepID=UPI0005CC267B|nr:CoA transferase [Sphingobium sp. YBL2]AJR24184.1 acetyl-CoA acetyltransferase [Sphingobium sp. YBL2]
MSGILDGVRIIDLSTVIMGPYASRILADLGADVIKVEAPSGDSVRAHRPHLTPTISGMFLNLNRNKRSIVLDLKSRHGQRALERLLETADVILHNLRAPVMKRLGFDYDRCRAIKPDIIYCAAYGFGADGPYASKPAYDDMIQAGSGFAALSQELTGAPAYAPSVICDKIVGQATANAILAGLVHKFRTNEGQAIEVPMLEVSIDFNLVEHFGGAAFVPPRGRPGYPRIRSTERRPFATADGYCCILPYSDRNWQDFFAFTGRADLMADERFRTLETRQDHFGELYAEVRKEAPRWTNAEWVGFCESADIPCMPVIDLEHIHDDPHVRAVHLFDTVEHPAGGTYRAIRSPVNYGASSFEIRHHAPELGQHTREILAEIGCDEEPVP